MMQPIIPNSIIPAKLLQNSLNLSSIPNSAQLNPNITNTSFRNFAGVRATPPPPSLQLLQLQQNPYICNSNSSSGVNNTNKLPPGLPMPAPSIQRQQQQMPLTSSIPNLASISNINLSMSPTPQSLPPSTPMSVSVGCSTPVPNKNTKSRKRGKRGGKQKQNKLKDEIIDPTKRDLINAIGLERRNHELTKLRLHQLHQYYGNMLEKLKQESKYLKNKITILKNGPSQNDLEIISKQKQLLRIDYLKKRGVRVKDEVQLKQTNKENQKLVIIIHYLKQQLDGLLSQYQELCRNETPNINEQGFSDAQIIVNNLDSLDIVDADSMLSPEKHQLLNTIVGGNSMPQRINEDPWFQKIIEENRMLERHIRFLRHIIERETQRCSFKEIIVGKKLLSQQKIPLKMQETDVS